MSLVAEHFAEMIHLFFLNLGAVDLVLSIFQYPQPDQCNQALHKTSLRFGALYDFDLNLEYFLEHKMLF